MRRQFSYTFLVLAMGSIFSCNTTDQQSVTQENQGVPASMIPPPNTIQVNVLNVYPHDTTSFTQGLLVHEGQLYEGTGGSRDISHYRSWVGKVDLKSGIVGQKADLGPNLFGEGITILNGKLYQLTWQNHKAFVYDAKTLKRLQEFSIKTEGWGLTNDSSQLILSDGSSNLYFLDPNDFSNKKILSVVDNNGPVNNLNELEYINGYIYANRWQTSEIIKIDPSNGHVLGKADLTGLLEKYGKDDFSLAKYHNGEAVLNGIAYDAASGRIYITGKLWPSLFEVTFQ